MVITDDGIDLIEEKILDSFDDDTHIAVGTGTTTAVKSDTTLSGEVLRKTFESKNKDTTNNYYEFQMRISLDELGASTVGNYGVVDGSSSGNFSVLGEFDSTFTQGDGEEIYFTIRAKPNVVNN